MYIYIVGGHGTKHINSFSFFTCIECDSLIQPLFLTCRTRLFLCKDCVFLIKKFRIHVQIRQIESKAVSSTYTNTKRLKAGLKNGIDLPRNSARAKIKDAHEKSIIFTQFYNSSKTDGLLLLGRVTLKPDWSLFTQKQQEAYEFKVALVFNIFRKFSCYTYVNYES